MEEELTAPHWLKEQLEYKKPMMKMPIIDLQNLLRRIERPKDEERPEVWIWMTKDASRSRKHHIVESVVDKDKRNLTPQDFQFSSINLGPMHK